MLTQENDIINIYVRDFKTHWLQSVDNGQETGIALLLEPSGAFYSQKEDTEKNKLGFRVLYSYLLKYKRYLAQVIIGLIVGSILQLILPFLTQGIVDVGIEGHNLKFIYLVCIAQFVLILSRTLVDFIRNRILFYISTHINISILSDFWIKMMRLPLSFFDIKRSGDTMQRINDHQRIEKFLTSTTLDSIFSLFNLILFSFIILFYNKSVYFIFFSGSILYVLWIRIFLKHRRKLDYSSFSIAAQENSATMQMIFGMQEIKLNNAENLRRWRWESLQAALFKIDLKSLTLSQYQQTGALFINETKNLLITFFVAKAVFESHLTLGAMISIQYIIGQLNAPIEQLVNFIQKAQDARISLERLNEIHRLEDEDSFQNSRINDLPKIKSIDLNSLSFTYTGAGNDPVLKNINLHIPEGKMTAIVGMSGSGKTTLLKLLLRYYENYNGEITIGNQYDKITLKNINHYLWRSQCGSVMQGGFIFSDTIAANIAISDEIVDQKKLTEACRIANVLEFIESLPLRFNTKIGDESNGISQGQKQRILIARAVYKSPYYLFFDEATNALDSRNESIIIDNLNIFFKGRTVVVVAHRLSTVKNADQIVVLHDGRIAEIGNHSELSSRRGYY